MKYISFDGLAKLKEELKECKTIKRQEIAKRLQEAKALGDLSENTEYSSAKEAQAFNEGKILKLEDVIKKAILINPSRRGKKKVQIGSIVNVEMISGVSKKKGLPKFQTFMIIGSHEADPGQGRISNESPLGQSFFGREVGDKIEIETPNGKVRYKIVSIK